MLVIGIAGGTGSGKTTIAHKLYKIFKEQAVIIPHDYYYKPHPELSLEERSKQNYDHPDALDTELLIEHIKQLKEGKSIHTST